MRRAPLAFLAVHLGLGLVALSSGCGSPQPAPKPPVVPDKPIADKPTEPALPDPQPPELRLPTSVKPTRHEVSLVIDPAKEVFSGSITIDLAVSEATSVIWLHGIDLDIKRANVAVGTEAIAVRPIAPGKDLIGLVLAKPVPVGKAKLAIAYTGKLKRDSGTGIYSAREGEDFYAYTQFEAHDARRAFPCFDEPSFKAPWKLSIRSPKKLEVIGNTPVESSTEVEGDKVVTFKETPPLPSYLVAFAVGPFDIVDAGKTRGGKPIRIVVSKGRGKDVAYPVEATRPIVDLLEDYFGMPYPYDKLDMLACEVFNAGAMENPGLITWRNSIIYTKPSEITLGKQQSYAAIAAHELAHMWFGDYVTLAWWDDTWLNESFASWMASKIIDQWKPKWDAAIEAVGEKSGVMGQDSLDTARAIRQPIDDIGDIEAAFDGITYEKGQSVLAMLERHVGADAFRSGVQQYLADHAWGNAVYDDFVSAITKAAGKDMKPMFDSFILQSGVPTIAFELSCKTTPTLSLTQSRYKPTGSDIDPKRTWQIPVCVRWGAGTATGRDCTVLGTETATLPLSAKSCPDWVMPNADEIGYYRMSPKGKLLDNLLAKAPKALTLPERIGLLGDVNAMVSSGELGNGVALGLVEALSKDKDQRIVDASLGIVNGIDDMVPDNLRANYERLIKKLYRARAVELGFHSKPNEDDKTKQLRPSLIGMVAEGGNDKPLIDEATKLAWKWLDDHKAVEPELVGTVLGIAAHFGDQKLFDRLHADAKAAKDRQERGRLLRAMGSFVDPKIAQQAWALSMTDEFELREALGLLNGGFTDPRTKLLAYEFMKKNFDAITLKLPEPFRPYMAYTFVPLCDESKKPEIEAFFKPRLEKLDGGAKTYAQALEQLGLCARQRKAQTPAVVAFLKRQ